MADAETIARARKNGISAGQFVPPGERPARVDEVVDLLVGAAADAHIGVRRPANALLEAMGAYGPWRITSARHRGGLGDARRQADANEHITLRVGNRGYHLQLTREAHLRRITGDDGAELIPPWLPPGAAVP